MKWIKETGYPERWASDDRRFEIARMMRRYNIQPRPVTVTRIILLDKETGERYDHFRILREAKEKALQLKEGDDGKTENTQAR